MAGIPLEERKRTIQLSALLRNARPHAERPHASKRHRKHDFVDVIPAPDSVLANGSTADDKIPTTPRNRKNMRQNATAPAAVNESANVTSTVDDVVNKVTNFFQYR